MRQSTTFFNFHKLVYLSKKMKRRYENIRKNNVIFTLLHFQRMKIRCTNILIAVSTLEYNYFFPGIYLLTFLYVRYKLILHNFPTDLKLHT